MDCSKKVTALIILDGFGYSKEKEHNAIYHAKTPFYDSWIAEYPHAFLHASGKYVGLPEGNIGSSEAGHLTIGAGRIIQEPVTLINKAIKDGTLASHPTLLAALEKIKATGKTLHIMGLISDAGVHSDLKQLYALLDLAEKVGVKHIVLHAFLDGRDSPPQSAAPFLTEIQKKLELIGGTIGTLSGRLYAMDRDKNWERTELCYQVLTEPQQQTFKDWQSALKQNYTNNINDEFIPPTQLDPNSTIKDGDGIIFFNFRPDRARQLTASFVDKGFKNFKTKDLDLAFFITPTKYDKKLETNALFTVPQVENGLKQALSDQGKTIFAIAETEKYAHVTYFFSGGKEASLPNETQVLVPSKHKKEYSNNPEMSADEITQTVLKSLRNEPADFYLINYANADMVGHTGNFGATIQAVEFLDRQIAKLYRQIVEKMDGTMYITSDHGNAEDMYDEQARQPRTAHTTNPVPFIMLRQDLKHAENLKLSLTKLSDIAPFILKNMGLSVPKEMRN